MTIPNSKIEGRQGWGLGTRFAIPQPDPNPKPDPRKGWGRGLVRCGNSPTPRGVAIVQFNREGVANLYEIFPNDSFLEYALASITQSISVIPCKY